MSWADGDRLRGSLWASLSGLLLALAFPRADLGLLGLAALTPFLLGLGGLGWRAALLRGYLCGLTFFLVLISWMPRVMVRYGGLPRGVAWSVLLLLALYLATYVAMFALLLAAAWRERGPIALLSAPVLWVGLEFAREHILTGFPWGALGYTQYRNLPLLQTAAGGGIYAVSFLVMAANAGLALLMTQPATRRARSAGLLLLSCVAVAEAGGLLLLRRAPESPESDRVMVAAVQGNVPQDRKWVPGEEARILDDLVRLTRQAAAAGARLIVWPESSSPFSFRRPVASPTSGRPAGNGTEGAAVQENPGYTRLVEDLARELGVSLIAGSVDYTVRDGEVRALNSAFAIGPEGELGPSYDKIHLVPFGEYVPLQRLLFFVNRMAGGAIAGFAPGRRFDPLPTAAGPAATTICYEAIFPGLVRRVARDGVLLVNITNDAWFGRSAAPRQHLAIAVVRAVENRRYLLRAANTGISALVDPYGRILAETPLERQTVLLGRLAPRRQLSPYARAGDWLAWACAILTILHAAAHRAAFGRESGRFLAREP